jgi:hypothetical protein
MDTYNNSLQIIEDKKTLTQIDFTNKWSEFKGKYPKLYSMLISSESVDLEMLKFICENVEINSKLTSKEERLELEIKVGDKLAHQYIYTQTNLPQPTQQQREFIKEKLRNKLNT